MLMSQCRGCGVVVWRRQAWRPDDPDGGPMLWLSGGNGETCESGPNVGRPHNEDRPEADTAEPAEEGR